MLNVSRLKLMGIFLVCFLSVYLSVPTFFSGFLNESIKPFFLSHKMNLGLDLQGGAYILLEVDLESYEKEQTQKLFDQIKIQARKNKIDIENSKIDNGRIFLTLQDKNKTQEFSKLVYDTVGSSIAVINARDSIELSVEESTMKSMRRDLVSQTMEIVRRRLDESGTKELDIQMQGENYILVQVPGVKDPEQIKRILGKTAKMTFHIVDDSVTTTDALRGKLPQGSKVMPFNNDKDTESQAQYIVIQSRAILTGDMLIDSHVGITMGNPVVTFKFNNIAARIFGEATSQNRGKRLAIVLDNKVISAPVINEPIMGGSGEINGQFSVQSANELALLLRAGALPVPLKIAEERTVGPSLGLDSIESGGKAAIVGTLAVMLFMFLFYGLFGMIANVALFFNLLLTISILALFNATLTMPGIAGMVLALGMAVDANVLIFERIKEEAKKGRTPLAAIESGYNLAYSTIIDSNLTTLLTTFILFIFGSGSIKGFAVTISAGIICSMFTAIMLSKVIIIYWYRKAKPKHLSISA